MIVLLIWQAHNLHCVSSPVTVTFTDTTTGAGLLSCNCMAGGSGKLYSSLTHEPFIDAVGIEYESWVKATSMNPNGRISTSKIHWLICMWSFLL